MNEPKQTVKLIAAELEFISQQLACAEISRDEAAEMLSSIAAQLRAAEVQA